MKENFTLIIPAAGLGRRLGADTAKAFVDLGGAPMLCRTMERFDDIESIAQRIVAVRADDVDTARKHLEKWDVTVLEGGALRQDSVAAALSAAQCDYVAIHDGARPFVSRNLIQRVLEGALETGAAVAAIPVTDTVKRAENDSIAETIPRNGLWAAQTPQAFHTDLLRRAFDGIQGAEVTDDARLVETTGHPVRIVEGERGNIKITTPEDLEEARWILQKYLKKAKDSASDGRFRP